jgi:peptidyl-tRNA hydrolase
VFENLRGLPRRTFRDIEQIPRALVLVVDDSRIDGQIAPEAQILQASVQALMTVLASEEDATRDAVDAWVAGRIRKIVKRARGASWSRALTCGLPVEVAQVGRAHVAAFAPVELDGQPPELRRLQVTGLQSSDDTPAETPRPHLAITLDAALGMSTGKRVAQVGHAAQLFAMYGPQTAVQDWAGAGFPVRIDTAELLDESGADVAVHDAGFTEVPEGALTCVAVYRPGQ